jgi:uncharacterized protein (TIGR02996 family)
MTCHDAFVQAICNQPHHDEPRLIYADWLEERGDPRGEFIRIQCVLAGTVEDAGRRHLLETRERELIQEFGPDWIGPLQGVVDKWEFRRGFLHRVVMTPGDFVWYSEQLFALGPVQHVHFYRRNDVRRGEVQALAECPQLARLNGITFNTDRGLRDDSIGLLAESPFLAGLCSLDLRFNWIRNAGAELLAKSIHLGGLETLHLGSNLIGRDGKQALRERFGDRVRF